MRREGGEKKKEKRDLGVGAAPWQSTRFAGRFKALGSIPARRDRSHSQVPGSAAGVLGAPRPGGLRRGETAV